LLPLDTAIVILINPYSPNVFSVTQNSKGGGEGVKITPPGSTLYSIYGSHFNTYHKTTIKMRKIGKKNRFLTIILFSQLAIAFFKIDASRQKLEKTRHFCKISQLQPAVTFFRGQISKI